MDIGHLLFAWNAGPLTAAEQRLGAERAASLARGAQRCQRSDGGGIFAMACEQRPLPFAIGPRHSGKVIGAPYDRATGLHNLLEKLT